jgi:hypothetical protein
MALRLVCQAEDLKWVSLLTWLGANPRSKGLTTRIPTVRMPWRTPISAVHALVRLPSRKTPVSGTNRAVKQAKS